MTLGVKQSINRVIFKAIHIHMCLFTLYFRILSELFLSGAVPKTR